MTNTTKSRRVKITNRLEKCLCGCKGSDSWHAATFKRVVRNVREVTDEVREGPRAARSLPCRVLREGVAKFPWGTCRVIEIATGSYTQIWDGDDFVRLDWNDVILNGELRSSGWWIATCDHVGCPGEGCTEVQA